MTDRVNDLHVRVWGEGERVVLVHGSNSPDPGRVWGEQRPLAAHYQLIVPDRRGYGHSPIVERPDFEVDVGDVITLLGKGAHLVGFSYGGVVSLLAAGRRPDLVRSLAVVEPPAFGVAKGNPAVEAIVTAQAPLYSDPDMTPERFIAGFMRSLGYEGNEDEELPPERRKAASASMGEPPPWEADIPLDVIAAAPYPKLVVSGDWREAMEVVADAIAERTGAYRVVIKGAGHGVPHIAVPFNGILAALIESARTGAE